MRATLRALGVSILLFAGAASAAPIEVDSALDALPLTTQLELLEDPGGTLAFDAARASTAFAPAPAKGPNLGFSRSAWWARFTLRNRDAHDARVLLRQDYPLIDYVDLWSQDRDGAWRAVETGDRRVFATREFEHRNFVFSIDLPAGAERTVYLRFASSGPVDISLALYGERALFAAVSKEQLAYGVYFGGFLVLVFYNFFIFLVVRDRAFFFYLLYAISYGLYFAIHNGIAFQFFWPGSPAWGNQSLLVMLALTLVFGLQFTRMFLDTARQSPRLDRFAIVLQAIAGLALAASFALPYSALILPVALLTVLVTVAILVLGTKSLAAGYRPARYFMLAWIALLVGVLAYMLKVFGVLPHNALTQNGFQVGSLLEMVLLSVALASRVRELQHLSRTDPLTKLANRRAFDERIALEFERAQRGEISVALLVADIDHFKEFNDRHGHTRGDDVLKLVAARLRDGVRARDVVCRYGGEEFALILPATDAQEAMAIAESLRAAIESEKTVDARVTVSIGVASSAGRRYENAEDLFRDADRALYSAKHHGRNRVERLEAA